MADYEETVPSVLLPCNSCGRTFRPEALSKHVIYCEKTLIKKRKVFDSAKQRIQGTDLAEFLPVLTHKKKNEKSPIRKTQSKWKEKHMELVRAIRAARVAPSADAPIPVTMKPVDHEKCPHCERYFGPKAFDRHLEWCKEHRTRIQPKSPASIQAKERLEARTKYRAPLLSKSRRAITKEKYQPRNRAREPSPAEHPPHRSLSSSSIISKNTLGPPKEVINNTINNNNNSNNSGGDAFKRQQPLRNSRRNPSPVKKSTIPPPRSKTGNNFTNNNDNSTKEKQVSLHPRSETRKEIKDDNSPRQVKEDIFTASCNISPITPIEVQRVKLKTPTNHNSMETYDPYKSAERQMKELLGLTDEDEVIDQSLVPQPHLISSPSSAFAKFSPIQQDKDSEDSDNSTFPPSEFDINDRRTVEAIRSSPTPIETGGMVDRNLNPISLSSISLCSTISIESFDSSKNCLRKGISTSAKVQSYDKGAQLPIKRSSSVVDSPHRKGRDFLKNNLKMEHLLFGVSGNFYDSFRNNPLGYDLNDNTSDESLRSSDELLKRSTNSLTDTTQAEQDLLKSVSEFEKLFATPSSLKPLPTLIPSSCPENQFPPLEDNENKQQQQITGSKFSADSAYNSLNRKSPQLDESGVVDNGNSSGSESSLAPPTRRNTQGAKFCHECGVKFPVIAAKFCCNCGVRRLVI